MTPQPPTACAVQAPAQPALPGLDIASAVAASAMRCAFMGTVQRDAVLYTTPAHQPCVQVLVGQHIDHHPQAHPLLVTRLFEAGRAGQADATELAARLYASAAVIVLGSGLRADTWHGQPVLRLIHCLGITRQPAAPAATPNPTSPARGDH